MPEISISRRWKNGPNPKPIIYEIDSIKCWNCVSHCDNGDGYRIIGIKGRNIRLHRFIYEMFNGKIKKGMQIRHTCDNRKCINPDHLLSGTHMDNMIDKMERGRQAKGEYHGRAKLTKEQVTEIFNSLDTTRVLAKKYNVDQANISCIKKGKNWGWFTKTIKRGKE